MKVICTFTPLRRVVVEFGVRLVQRPCQASTCQGRKTGEQCIAVCDLLRWVNARSGVANPAAASYESKHAILVLSAFQTRRELGLARRLRTKPMRSESRGVQASGDPVTTKSMRNLYRNDISALFKLCVPGYLSHNARTRNKKRAAVPQ